MYMYDIYCSRPVLYITTMIKPQHTRRQLIENVNSDQGMDK